MIVERVELAIPNSLVIPLFDPCCPALPSTAFKISTGSLIERDFCLGAAIFRVKL